MHLPGSFRLFPLSSYKSSSSEKNKYICKYMLQPLKEIKKCKKITITKKSPQKNYVHNANLLRKG